VGDTSGQMLAGRAAIFGILRILRHFAVGDFVDQLRAQRLLVERDAAAQLPLKAI
jgi:hypothetical protein